MVKRTRQFRFRSEGRSGTWTCPFCQRSFYGGGESLHDNSCSVKDQGYEVCDYNFVRGDINRLLRGHYVPEGFTLEMLEQYFPSILKEVKEEMGTADL